MLFLTGGSSHLRAVHRTVEELLGGRPAGTLNDPKTVVAIGAHLVAADQAIKPARAANHDDPAPDKTGDAVGDPRPPFRPVAGACRPQRGSCSAAARRRLPR